MTGGAAGSVAVVLSRNLGAVVGTVKTASGGPAPGVVVTSWPRVPALDGAVAAAGTDQNGAFEIADLAPGRYFVAAWKNIDPALLEDTDFLSRFQNGAAAIEVQENGRAGADLTPIPSRRVAEEAGKLR